MQPKETSVRLQYAIFLQLADFCGHGASFYSEIVCKHRTMQSQKSAYLWMKKYGL
jgi:hypothetical protein